ncbi:hypothetical protein JCM10212_005450 [Sporobolomyces blumeae]
MSSSSRPTTPERARSDTATLPADAVLYVRALHTFSPESLPPDPTEAGTCLAFEQGQVIKCLNQDQSGWWDGELDGRRGWFPSNYVEVVTSGPDEPRSPTRSPRKRTATAKKHPKPPVTLSPEANTLLSSIEQNVGLLENAVNRSSKGHYQPSTACVISSIRTVLSATQALTRDSPVLRKHHSLASSRKHILSSLASLVNQARKASAPDDRGVDLEAEEASEMLRMAKETVGFVKGFLEEAERKGVEVNLGLGSSPRLEQGENDASGPHRELRSTKSIPSFDRRPTLDVLEHPLPVSTFPVRAESPAIPARRPSLRPPGATTSPVVLRTAAALFDHLSVLHDALLSTIAALIGHIHSHSRTASPASSFAQLIDLTREGIERVRDVLEVVEAVAGQPVKAMDVPEREETANALEVTRERLYVATTALVTAARIATSPVATEGTFPTREEEDEERKRLLGAATGVLRAGGDCVGQVKVAGGKVLEEGGPGYEIVLARSRRPSEYDVDSEDESDDRSPNRAKFADAPVDPAVGRVRNAHTLSMLGRKATSLSSLRQRFEHGDALGEEPEVEDSADGSHDGHDRQRRNFSPSDTLSSSSSSAPSTIAPHPSLERRSDASPARSSVPMSRNASSGSGSNAGSVISRTTASSIAGTYVTGETSPRSSYGTSSGTGPKFLSGGSSNGVPPLPATAVRKASTRPTSGGGKTRSLGRTSADHARSESPTVQRNSLNSPTNSSPLSQTASPFLPQLPPPVGTASSSPAERKPSTASSTPWFLERDYEPREISFNADGHVTGGTLRVLIERMTLHDTTIDPSFATTFLLTFRLFTTPLDLVAHLYRRFDLAPPRHPETGDDLDSEQLKQWTSAKLTPIRLRIYNLFKTWLESHWQYDADGDVVDGLREWSEGRLKAAMPAASTRLLDLIEKRVQAAEQERQAAQLEAEGRPSNASESSLSSVGFSNGFNSSQTSLQLPVPAGIQKSLLRMASTDRLKAGKPVVPFSSLSPVLSHSSPTPSVASSTPSSPMISDSYSPGSPTAAQAPTPIVSRSLLSALRAPNGRTLSVTDVDPLELARQLTIMESRVYCSIRPEELLGSPLSSSSSNASSSKKDGSVRKMSALSTRLTGWIAETILGETDQKKRTALVKYFVKLGERLLALNNYNALFAVFTALNSSTIARLRKTWDGLAPKYRQSLEVLRRATDHSRNYAEYRGKIRQTVPPCLPFVGLFLTDLIFVFEGNRAERTSPTDSALRLINFDRYQKMSRIVGDLQRFQVPYHLVEVPELQHLLSSSLEGPLSKMGQDAQSLYRQSLLIEPRSNAPSTTGSMDGRSRGGDLFNWRG